MANRNLRPGQYQIGDIVFGDGTRFPVEQFDIGGWEVNVQDYQAQLADENRFGSDSFKPNPIQITLTALRNQILPNMVGLTGDTRELNFANDRRVGEFTREWRADEVRKRWGELKPLYVCRPDGSVVQVYGRPGKLAVTREDPHSLTRKIVAEYRRSDTLCYNDFEWYTQLQQDEVATILRATALGQGDGPSWLRLLLVGPMNHPIVQVGDIPVELNWELEPGEVIEISSYPWERRVVRLNDGVNLAAYLVSPYLDKLSFDVETAIEVSWNATDTNVQKEERNFAEYSNTAEGLPQNDWYPTVYSGGTGHYELTNGVLHWVDDGNQTRLGVSVFRQQTVSPYQLVGFVMPNPAEATMDGTQEPANRIIGRSNANGTEYLYWDVTFTKFWFGYHKDGVDTRLSQVFVLGDLFEIFKHVIGAFFNSLFGIPTNWVYEAEFGTGAGELSSTLRINGVRTMSYTDTGTSGAPTFMDTNHLHTGIGMKATPRFLGQSTPGNASKFWMRDNSPTPLDVSGVYLFWRDSWQNI